MKNKIAKLIISIFICEGIGIIGSFFTTPSINTWYAGLIKPWFIPPNWVFAPAWTILFLLMGISLYLVWDKGFGKGVIFVFAVQLILNLLWSILFFGLHSPFFAFLEIIALWIAILFTILKFYPISRKAAYLLIPYILWVSFAAALNFAIMTIN